MSTIDDTTGEKYADKIAKLLRKAESTNSQEEADALFSKAQELMLTYAISEEMLAKAQGKTIEDKIVTDYIDYSGSYREALFDIGAAIARANDCKVLITKNAYAGYDDKGKMKTVTRLTMIGFRSDVDRVRLLDASIQIQAALALRNWAKENVKGYWSGMEKYKQRRAFLFGYASGLSAQLMDARRAAVKTVSDEHGEKGVALVLADKSARVKDWMDEQYGNSLRTVKRSYEKPAGGFTGGFNAGKNANVNRPSVGGNKGALGR